MWIQLLFPIVVYFPSFPLLILLFGSHLIILIYHSSIHSLSFVGDIAAFIILFDVCVMYIGWFGRHLFLYWLFVEFWLWCWCHSLYVYVLLLCYCCTCNTWAYNYHILINITHRLFSQKWMFSFPTCIWWPCACTHVRFPIDCWRYLHTRSVRC